jgi:hypothetical protein
MVSELASSRVGTAASRTRPTSWGHLPLAGDSEEDS